MLGIGPGVTYFLNTANMYASASLTITTLTLSASDHFVFDPAWGSTGAGIGMGLAFGKEWWISSNWGMGLAAQLRLASTLGKSQEMAATGFSLLFSTTYN
jgi:hypothetical protein